MIKRIKKAISIFIKLQNWFDIYRNVFFKRPLSTIIRRDGIRFLGQPEMVIWNHYNDIWEYKSYTNIIDIQKSDIVIDIGANIGLFTVLAAQKAKIVFSFEPMKNNVEFLKKNVEMNDLKNVNIYNIAIAGENERRHIHTTGSTTAYNLFTKSNEEVQNEILIECKKLRNFMDEIEIIQCDFLKMDCEGCEFEILLKMPENYLKRIKTICMEFHDHLSTYTHKDIIKFLNKHNFETIVTKTDGTFGMMLCRNNDY